MNIICESLITAIKQTIYQFAPAKRIQLNNKIPDFVSQNTKDIIRQREEAMVTMKTTQDEDDIRNFRTLRNHAHKMIKQDKERHIKKTFNETEGDTRQQWKTTKSHVGWIKNLSLSMISKEGKKINDPKGIADAINIAQI